MVARMSGLFESYNPSNQYQFYPSNAEIVASAFGRIQIRRTELEPEHIQNAISELNFFLTAFNTAGPNLAQIDLQSFPLVAGQATYSLPPETVMLTDLFVSYPGGGSPSGTVDLYLYPISRTDYAALPNKLYSARPNQYWLDRLQTPTVTFFPVPDGNGPYIANYYRMRQVQDSLLANGMSPEVPNRALDAVVAGLAYRLARVYKPELEAVRKGDAGEAWALYAKQDTENAPLYLMPALASYWRI
jgi:hypothetical protein